MKKISIITVCYNSAATISETIDSVLSQTYSNIEYIVCDGLSTDGTQDIVNSYGSKISKFVSEKDRGLYDAMNKAIEMTSGEVIGILNSDDLYANPHIISTVMNEFEKSNVDCVFGDLYYFKTGKPEKPIRYYRGKNFSRRKITMGILPPHPTFFVRRSVYEKHGTFDLQFKYAADFDLMARLLYIHRVSFTYIPMIMVKMRIGGISTSSLRQLIRINKEDIESCRKNGIPTNFLLFHFKYLFKVLHIRSVSGLFNKY